MTSLWNTLKTMPQSRKVVFGALTGLVTWLGKILGLSDEVCGYIVLIGIALIFGTAIEDHGAKMGLPPPTPPPEPK